MDNLFGEGEVFIYEILPLGPPPLEKEGEAGLKEGCYPLSRMHYLPWEVGNGVRILDSRFRGNDSKYQRG
jgi:hypothetical protein